MQTLLRSFDQVFGDFNHFYPNSNVIHNKHSRERDLHYLKHCATPIITMMSMNQFFHGSLSPFILRDYVNQHYNLLEEYKKRDSFRVTYYHGRAFHPSNNLDLTKYESLSVFFYFVSLIWESTNPIKHFIELLLLFSNTAEWTPYLCLLNYPNSNYKRIIPLPSESQDDYDPFTGSNDNTPQICTRLLKTRYALRTVMHLRVGGLLHEAEMLDFIRGCVNLDSLTVFVNSNKNPFDPSILLPESNSSPSINNNNISALRVLNTFGLNWKLQQSSLDRFRRLKEIRIAECVDFSDSDFEVLKALRSSLEVLVLHNVSPLTGGQAFDNVFKETTELRVLSITACPQVEDLRGLRWLPNQLQQLTLQIAPFVISSPLFEVFHYRRCNDENTQQQQQEELAENNESNKNSPLSLENDIAYELLENPHVFRNLKKLKLENVTFRRNPHSSSSSDGRREERLIEKRHPVFQLCVDEDINYEDPSFASFDEKPSAEESETAAENKYRLSPTTAKEHKKEKSTKLTTSASSRNFDLAPCCCCHLEELVLGHHAHVSVFDINHILEFSIDSMKNLELSIDATTEEEERQRRSRRKELMYTNLRTMKLIAQMPNLTSCLLADHFADMRLFGVGSTEMPARSDFLLTLINQHCRDANSNFLQCNNPEDYRWKSVENNKLKFVALDGLDVDTLGFLHNNNDPLSSTDASSKNMNINNVYCIEELRVDGLSAEYQPLQQFPNLRVLDLSSDSRNTATDLCLLLESCSATNTLEFLNLESTNSDDAVLSLVCKKFTKLKGLSLSKCRHLTDKTPKIFLDEFVNVEGFEVLDVHDAEENTQIRYRNANAKSLKKKFPILHIFYDSFKIRKEPEEMDDVIEYPKPIPLSINKPTPTTTTVATGPTVRFNQAGDNTNNINDTLTFERLEAHNNNNNDGYNNLNDTGYRKFPENEEQDESSSCCCCRCSCFGWIQRIFSC